MQDESDIICGVDLEMQSDTAAPGCAQMVFLGEPTAKPIPVTSAWQNDLRARPHEVSHVLQFAVVHPTSN
jgi:hypothetical protein